MIALCLTTLSLLEPASAAEVRLQWDPVGDPRVAAYEVHYGLDSGVYEQRVDTASSTVTVARLQPGATYYFAVRACPTVRVACSPFSDEVSATIPASAPGAGQDVAIEVGEVAVSHESRRVNFEHPFSDPIVIAKSLSYIGGAPAVVRIDGVDAGGFWIGIQEWDYLDGVHATETVGYLVTERGRHQLADGTWIEADRVETSATNASEWTAFKGTFNAPPVVLAGVTTVNEIDAVTGRVRNIDGRGFGVGLREQEAFVQSHAIESIDYIAWEPSSGVSDGLRFEVGRTADEVTDQTHSLAFQNAFDTPPVFIAGMQTTDGGDTANLRWHAKTASRVDVWVDEEQSHDSETTHTTEVVGYFVFE